MAWLDSLITGFRQLNAIKREQYPWMLNVTKSAPQEAIRSLGTAYKNWFNSLSGKRKGQKVGAPTFKKKFKRDSFKFDEKFEVEGSRIRIPKLGWVRMREPLRFKGSLKGATVSRTAHAWFVAILIDTATETGSTQHLADEGRQPEVDDEVPVRSESQAAVGVDLGIKALATFSDGSPAVEGPKALGMLLHRLRRLSRAHSRKVKGSANRKKSAQRLARLHWRISCIRQDAMHKLTHRLTRDYGYIAIEDLNVRGMMANGKLARHIADAEFGEFHRLLTYKAEQRGCIVGVADRWYPSSKTCSHCGFIHAGLKLSDREWTCVQCEAKHERDYNAACNILSHCLAQETNQTLPLVKGMESVEQSAAIETRYLQVSQTSVAK